MKPDENIFVFGNPDFCYFGCTVQFLRILELPLVLKFHHVLYTGKIGTSPKLLYQGLHEMYMNISLFVICGQKSIREKSVYQLFGKTHTNPTCLVQNNNISKGTNRKHHSHKKHYFSSQF